MRLCIRLTPAGDTRLGALLLDDETAGDDDRSFAIRLAFCRHLDPPDRLALLERRRAVLASRLSRAERNGPGRGDRYARSLLEHRNQSTGRDLEWVDSLIATERREASTETTFVPIISVPANDPGTEPTYEPTTAQGATAS